MKHCDVKNIEQAPKLREGGRGIYDHTKLDCSVHINGI